MKIHSRELYPKIFMNDAVVDVDGQGTKTASELLAYLSPNKKLNSNLRMKVLHGESHITFSIKTFAKK